ncbi:hypothetical protein QL285_034068 [Trifolium repens]|nr:hypothetical protein QL285_034068 [Trifolium repens]
MIRLNGKEVELTPVASQMTGPITLSLFASDIAEDYVGSVLAKTCELEIDLGWYYQTCTLSASKVITQAGIMFKVHVQVIDNSE